MLELKNINKVYKSKKGLDVVALNNVNLKLNDTGMVFIVGKSGSGKSTLLNIISGLDKYDSGEIIVENKSFNRFRNSDFDSYRNTYIGFVFQDFNLFSECNVCQNISLSLNLQKKKVSKENIVSLLQKVGLSGLEKRNINELSGGQKQRVAIARALIKNPKIILADEPTGALDVETSTQIFSLLKEISKDRLVVVVSHDIEAARNYADRIIMISDGTIIGDTRPNNNISINVNNEIKLIKSKFSFFASIRFSLSNLKHKKVRLLFTILLTTFALSFFGMSCILSNFNIPYSHAKAMISEKDGFVAINKNYLHDDGSYQANSEIYMPFSETDINFLENMLQRDTIKVYSLFENGRTINFNIAGKINSNTPAYYAYIFSQPYFIELNSSEKFKLIGNYPKQYDEIIIHKYLADYIIYNGIYLYQENTVNNLKTPELYKPTSYEQIISENKYIQLGSTKVKIVGIIDDDLSKYDKLKNVNYSDITEKEESSLNDFINRFGNNANKIYVMKGFIENVALNGNNTVDDSDFLFSFKTETSDVPINSVLSKLTNEITLTDGFNNIKINSIADNEIVINKEYLNAITKHDFDKQLASYLKNNENTTSLSDEQLELNFVNQYLTNNNIIGSNLNLKVTDYNKKVNNNISTIISNVKIVGYTNSDTIYLSNNILDKYMHSKYEVNKLYFYEYDQSKLENIFTEIPINQSKFTTETSYSKNIILIEDSLSTVSQIAFYLSIVFFVFSMVLLMNFVSSTISSNKKQIGILRALGTKKKDVFKIYLFEGLIIGLFSLILSLAICYLGCIFGNNILTEKYLFNIEPIIFSSKVILYLFSSVILVVIISAIIPSYKISNMKPIDAIYEK